MIFFTRKTGCEPGGLALQKAAGRMGLQNSDFLVTQVDIKFLNTESGKKKKCPSLIAPEHGGAGKFTMRPYDLPSQSHRLQLERVEAAALEVSEGVAGEQLFFSF